jgi:hypothetical protein
VSGGSCVLLCVSCVLGSNKLTVKKVSTVVPHIVLCLTGCEVVNGLVMLVNI